MAFSLLLLLASAQVGEFGAREQDLRNTSSRTATIQLAEYVDCVVADKSRVAAITRFLREFPEDKTKSKSGSDAINVDCMSEAARRYPGTVTMSLSWEAFRGALYPALYRRDFGKSGPPPGIAGVEPLSLAGEFDRETSTLPADYRPRRRLGDCVARQAPQDAHALLMAKPYSKVDNEALSSLGSALAACLPEGEAFRLNRNGLRAYIGEAMYKLALAADPQSMARPRR